MKSTVNRIKKIFLIGILIRLFIMPFFAYHEDIFMVHLRAFQITKGVFPFSFREPVTHTIEAFFLILFKPLLGNSLNFLHLPPLAIPNLNRLLFLFKLPYLIFEIAFWKVFLKLIKTNQNKIKAAWFLILNPILIYSIYIFGRYESYPLLFLCLLLLNLKKPQSLKQNLTTSVLLSALILSRLFFVILLIPILISSKIKNKLLLLILPLTLLALNLYFSGQGSGADFSGWITSNQHTNYFFGLNWGLGALSANLYPFFILLTLIILLSIHKKLSFIKTTSCLFLIFFASCIYHPQYLAWLIPFFALLIFSTKKDNQPTYLSLFIFLIPLYFINLLSWNRFTTTDVFFPISQTITQINLAEIVSHIYPLQKVIGISRSLSTAIFLFTIFKIFKTDD